MVVQSFEKSGGSPIITNLDERHTQLRVSFDRVCGLDNDLLDGRLVVRRPIRDDQDSRSASGAVEVLLERDVQRLCEICASHTEKQVNCQRSNKHEAQHCTTPLLVLPRGR